MGRIPPEVFAVIAAHQGWAHNTSWPPPTPDQREAEMEAWRRTHGSVIFIPEGVIDLGPSEYEVIDEHAR